LGLLNRRLPLSLHQLYTMNSIRQDKVGMLVQKELSTYFQQNARTICLGAMVTVTKVRVSSDLSVAKIYLSVFAGPDKNEVLKNLKENVWTIRHFLANSVKHQMRKTPELVFYLDDSLDYAEKIDSLLKANAPKSISKNSDKEEE
jgi:ribosome-binding factor A